MLVYLCKGSLNIKSSHSLHENDAEFQTHPPKSAKIHVHNFRYKISVAILMKLFFLSHKCINKFIIASSAQIKFVPLLVPTLVNCKLLGWSAKNQFLLIFDALANIFPVPQPEVGHKKFCNCKKFSF